MSELLRIPDTYTKEVPNLWSVTRTSGKSTLVAADTELEALRKHERVASLAPELGWKQDPTVSVRKVACIT